MVDLLPPSRSNQSSTREGGRTREIRNQGRYPGLRYLGIVLHPSYPLALRTWNRLIQVRLPPPGALPRVRVGAINPVMRGLPWARYDL